MPIWSYEQNIFQQYHSNKYFLAFYLQHGSEKLLAYVWNKSTSLSPYRPKLKFLCVPFLQLLLISQLSNRFLQPSFTSAFIESPLSVVLLQHAFERRFYQSPTLLSVIVRDSFRHATSRCWSDRSSNKHKTVVNTRLRRRSGVALWWVTSRCRPTVPTSVAVAWPIIGKHHFIHNKSKYITYSISQRRQRKTALRKYAPQVW